MQGVTKFDYLEKLKLSKLMVIEAISNRQSKNV